MKIYLGVDHQGVKYKDLVEKYLKNKEIKIIISNLPNHDLDDYPDFAYEVAKNVSKEESSLGILICGSGIGMSIAANKVSGIRCARVCDESDAFTAKNHNGANIIALSSNLEENKLLSIIDTFIKTEEPTEERHLRRIEKINKIERENYEH